jgi:hypothetical protein
MLGSQRLVERSAHCAVDVANKLPQEQRLLHRLKRERLPVDGSAAA